METISDAEESTHVLAPDDRRTPAASINNSSSVERTFDIASHRHQPTQVSSANGSQSSRHGHPDDGGNAFGSAEAAEQRIQQLFMQQIHREQVRSVSSEDTRDERRVRFSSPPRREDGPSPHDGSSDQRHPNAPLGASSFGETPSPQRLDISAISDRELLDALEQRVNETIARLDAGYDYVQDDLNEAIVQRRLVKNAALGSLVTGDAREAALRDVATAASLLPPLMMSIEQLYPRDTIEFEAGDSSSMDEANSPNGRAFRTASSSAELSSADEYLTRPPSTNDCNGIRPYRPPPGGVKLCGSDDEVDISREEMGDETRAQEGSRKPPTALPTTAAAHRGCAQHGNPSCVFRRGLQSCYKACHMFLVWGVVFPLALVLAILSIFRFAGGRICSEECLCNAAAEVFKHLASYSLLMRVVPRSVFFTYLLHVLAYSQHRRLLEAGGQIGDGNVELRGARMMMSMTRQGGRSGSSMRASPRTPALPASVVPWDIPTLRFCARQTSFVVICASCIVVTAAAINCTYWGIPVVAATPVEAFVFGVPLIAGSFYLRVPEVVWPLLLLEVTPFLGYFCEPRMVLPFRVFHLLWPFVVTAIERVLFYVLYSVSLDSTPVGARIAETTILSFASHVLTLGAAVRVDPHQHPKVITGICFQIFLYEMLLGTMTLDRLWIFLKAKWYYHVYREKPKPQDVGAAPLSASDLRCVATQTRWTSAALAVLSVAVMFVYRKWPRSLHGGGLDCSGNVAGHMSGAALGCCVAAYVGACFCTAAIRCRNKCLRPPLSVRGRGFSLLLGLYLMLTVAMAMAAARE